MKSNNKNVILRGQAASPGLIESKVYIIKNTAEFVQIYTIDNVDKEIERFREAIRLTKNDLMTTMQKVSEKIGDEYKGIFEAQILALEDQFVIDKTEKEIKRTKKNADYVYSSIVNKILESMEQIDDDYLRDRIFDIKDIQNKVLRKLKRKNDINDLSFDERVVLASYSLTPSDLINIDKRNINGIICETGSVTSHFAILARAMNIPSVVGINGLMKNINMWDSIIIDGYTGVIIVNPNETSHKMYIKKREEYKKLSEELKQIANYEAITLDQRTIELSANIELIEEVEEIKKYGAQGIGLFRTEFLYFDINNLPNINKHIKVYKKAADSVYPDTVIIRTVDIGGDKPVFVNKRELNPFLGFRGIRASLEYIDEFKEQIKAILIANEKGNLKIMLPIISRLEEIVLAKEIIEECKVELKKNGYKVNENIDLGIMVEVPSAALLADEFAKYVDFFSIGTNDLTQYTLAVDRTNPRVSNIYDNLDPSILKLIDITVKAAHDNHIWAGICGEMASMPLAVPILIGLELDELSISPVFVPEIKKIIRELTFAECRDIASNALSMKTAKEIREYMNKIIKRKFPNMHKYIEV